MLTSKPTDQPQFQALTWSRSKSDFATHIEVADVKGLLTREVIVEPGTSAILISDGTTLGVTPPGRYTLSSAGDTLRSMLSHKHGRQVSVVIVDTNDLDLSIRVDRAYTKDPIGVAVELRVVLCVPGWSEQGGAPKLMDFFMNVMKGARRFTLDDLVAHLQPEVENAVHEYLRTYTAADLNGSQKHKAALEEAVMAHLERTLQREGFLFKGVRALRIMHERIEAATQRKEELVLLETEEDQKLQKRRKLLEVLQANDILAIAEETQRVEMHERRSQLASRMRREVMNDRIDEMKTDDELSAFINRMDYTKVLRQDERDRQLQELREAREDRISARTLLLARLAQEADYEDALAALRRKSNLRQEEFDLQAEFLRKQMDRTFGQQIHQTEHEIQLKRMQADAEHMRRNIEREQRLREESDARIRVMENARDTAEVARIEMGIRLQNAHNAIEIKRANAEIERIDIETQQIKINMALSIKERNYAIERENDALKEERRLQSLEREMRMKLDQMRNEHLIAMESAKQAAAAELDKIKIISSHGPQGLIALSNPEAARLIADLQKTEVFGRMTPDQIQMLKAGDSAMMAQALIERYKSQATDNTVTPEIRALYERLITIASQTRPDAASELDALRTALRDQKSLAETLGRMIQDTAIGVSGNQAQHSQTVFVRGATNTGGTYGSVGAEREVKRCPICNWNIKIAEQNCPNCNNKLS